MNVAVLTSAANIKTEGNVFFVLIVVRTRWKQTYAYIHILQACIPTNKSSEIADKSAVCLIGYA